MSDERLYSNGAIRFLESNGTLITDHIEIEDKTDTDDDDLYPLFSQGQRSKRFWFKHNLVSATVQDDDTYKLEFYRAASQKSVHEEFAKWVVERKGDSKVSILIRKNGSLVANKVSFKPPVIDDLELNYGTGFGKVHEKIMTKLALREGKLMIFSGVTGSGKSTYIKYLSSICDREFIFIPVGMAGSLSSEDLLPLLVDHKECVLIIEDAEQIIQPRGSGKDDSVVSVLLNVSDGILGNLLRATTILTMNAGDECIDSAILRRGRLSFRHDFAKLSEKDAKRLAKTLGKDDKGITEATSLADVYGVGEDIGQPEIKSRQLGFHTLIPTPKTGETKEKEGS